MKAWPGMFVVLALLAGCERQSPAELHGRLAALVGISETELVRRVTGPPTLREVDGRRFVSFTEAWPYVPASPRGQMWGFDFQPNPAHRGHVCEANFEIVQDRVAGYFLRGDACGWDGWPVIAPG